MGGFLRCGKAYSCSPELQLQGGTLATKIHPLLTAEEQVEHMRGKGVKFEIMSADIAADYLQQNNNYYRLRSYRHGFERVSDGPNKGRYVNLDFAMLVDLATIDMHLRYQIMPLSLEIEHLFKLRLLTAAEKHHEDGYDMVRDFLSSCDMVNKSGKTRNHILEEIARGKDGPYTSGIIQHYCDSGYPIWAFLEVIPFGRFNQLWKFCSQRYNDKDMQDNYYLLQSAKGIRNACGHNNCILNDMASGTPKHEAQNTVRRAVRTAGISKQTAKSKLHNDRLIQLTTALYLHSHSSSQGIYNSRVREMNQLVDRIIRHPEYYEKCDQIRTGLAYIVKLIKAWYPMET